MSGTLPAHTPDCLNSPSPEVELLIDARPRDVGGFRVRRLLPTARRRSVGPFVFFDHMGPAQLAPGEGFDVPPHPHIGLSTVTYLFEGEVVHRDSLGTCQTIRPGDVNWMFAGRGIVHSERSPDAHRAHGPSLHGIQCWVALPTELEENEPTFEHHPERSIPRAEDQGLRLDVIAGTAFGLRSPVRVHSQTLYVHAAFAAGARLELDDEHEQRAVYVVEGEVACAGRHLGAGTMAVLSPGKRVALAATGGASRVMILGGAPLSGPRFIDWNFVSSSKARLERARRDWQEQRFQKIPGDDTEFVPLPKPLALRP